MNSLKLGLYALTLEISAWSGIWLVDANTDAQLLWYLIVHLFASLLLATAAAMLLPIGSPRQRLHLLLLMAGCSYGIPIAGFIGVIVGVLLLRIYSTKPARPAFESLRLPSFDLHQRPQAGLRQSSLRSFLGNSAVPIKARIGAMTALQYITGRVSTPLLRNVLSDPNEDIRLLAYGMIDNREKSINRAIDQELKTLADPSQDKQARLEANQRLSDLYWELIYQELAQGDLRDYAISESRRYCETVLASDTDNAPLYLRLGRLLHETGDIDSAERAYRQALELGLPATRVLPYLAELNFERRNFVATAKQMKELANWASLPRLRPVIDYWTRRQ
jgi:tetratricopeptide (TPR) repeat protein